MIKRETTPSRKESSQMNHSVNTRKSIDQKLHNVSLVSAILKRVGNTTRKKNQIFINTRILYILL